MKQMKVFSDKDYVIVVCFPESRNIRLFSVLYNGNRRMAKGLCVLPGFAFSPVSGIIVARIRRSCTLFRKGMPEPKQKVLFFQSANIVAFSVRISQGYDPDDGERGSQSKEKQVCYCRDHRRSSVSLSSPFLISALALLAQARLQYFLGRLYSLVA